MIRNASQRGQSLVIGALMLVVLIGVVGLAVDGAVSYGYSVALERAVSAAALAGVPYLPQKFDASNGTPNATSRATDEATRNGIDANDAACKCTESIARTNNGKNLVVSITQTVPTFFMQALGVPPFPIKRTAEAGYRPSIRLGSPDNQFGSAVSEIGTSGRFYVLRHKAWNIGGGPAEGDAYTPNPATDTSPGTTDVHAISRSQGGESSDPAISSSSTALPATDRGGQNLRVTVPDGATGELQVYNAGFGPDPPEGAAYQNACENWEGFAPPTGFKCNSVNTQNLAEEDGGQAQCTGGPPLCTAAQKGLYNTVMYTLFKVNDEFLRSTDQVILQTKIYPIDASNYKANPPTYVNVHDGTVITQTYGNGVNSELHAPVNMKTYHSWTNITTEAGGPDAASRTLIPPPVRFGVCSPSCPSLPAGTYRLRVDLLDVNGNVTTASFQSGTSNHAYALRLVNPGTLPDQSSSANVCLGTNSVKCTVGGWEDAAVVTTLSGNNSDGYIPLFELPAEYAGSTINIDLYDFGDAPQNVVSIMDPTGTGFTLPGGLVAGIANQPGLTITNEGINRNGNPLVQHKCSGSPGGGGQCPDGAVPIGKDDIPHIPAASTAASWCTAGCVPIGHPYNGTWIRVSIPIPNTYNPGDNDFWYAQYHLTGTAVDTFSFAVSAEGGPVHLISS